MDFGVNETSFMNLLARESFPILQIVLLHQFNHIHIWQVLQQQGIVNVIYMINKQCFGDSEKNGISELRLCSLTHTLPMFVGIFLLGNDTQTLVYFAYFTNK